MIKRYALIFFILSNCLLAQDQKDDQNGNGNGTSEAEKTVKKGNLAFPSSQQPNAFISFGQNILDKGQTQILCLATEFRGENQYFTNIIPSILHGITDNFSILFSAPIAPRNKQNKKRSAGIEDLILQFEYAYYTKAHKTYYDQATVIATVSIPTGSRKKDPPTGYGSSSFFIGGTLSRMSINWFYFVQAGGIVTTSNHGTKFGDQLLYQMGIGRRIASNDKWLFDWLVEFDGTYFAQNQIKGRIDKNSGGNVIYMTPSLWLSSKHLVFQIGAGYAIQQHWFGEQNRSKYLMAVNMGWTF